MQLLQAAGAECCKLKRQLTAQKDYFLSPHLGKVGRCAHKVRLSQQPLQTGAQTLCFHQDRHARAAGCPREQHSCFGQATVKVDQAGAVQGCAAGGCIHL